MSWVSAAIGAAGSLLGSAKSNSSNRGLSRKQMRFQERMSNSAYQRAMADMEKAGLNPILAAKVGPASTPGGSMPPQFNYGDAFSGFSANVTQSNLQESQSSKIEQEIENLAAQKKMTEQLTQTFKEQAKLFMAQSHKAYQEGTKLNYENIANAIIAKFKEENPTLTIMQAFGVDGSTLLNMFGQLFKLIKGDVKVQKGSSAKSRSNPNNRSTQEAYDEYINN